MAELIISITTTCTYERDTTSNYWNDQNLKNRMTVAVQKCNEVRPFMLNPKITERNKTVQLLVEIRALCVYERDTTSNYWSDSNLRNRMTAAVNNLDKLRDLYMDAEKEEEAKKAKEELKGNDFYEFLRRKGVKDETI